MRLLFDTSAFIALEDRADACHASAKRCFDGLTRADRCVTTNYVVDETITRLRYAIGWQAATVFADAILKSRLFEHVYVDADMEAAALSVMKRCRDQRLSFTDCATIAFARAQRIDAVFAFDEDFRKVGLRTLPDSR